MLYKTKLFNINYSLYQCKPKVNFHFSETKNTRLTYQIKRYINTLDNQISETQLNAYPVNVEQVKPSVISITIKNGIITETNLFTNEEVKAKAETVRSKM